MLRHYTIITKCITDGTLVPFLGAGANLCGRPIDAVWRHGATYLPSGRELAAFLAHDFDFPREEVKLHCPTLLSNGELCNAELTLHCPSCKRDVQVWEEAKDLLRIAQYVANYVGSRDLYNNLHKVFAAGCPPTPLHRFLATLPANLEKKGYPHELLVVTTNYDDLMERAFREAKQPFDVVTYVALGEHRGRFLYCPFQGKPALIEDPNHYADLLKQRPVILKIHGAVNTTPIVDRIPLDRDSYVIAEDDYIDYLAHFDIHKVLPKSLLSKLMDSHLLFLGYSLSDWNLRVILRRIWSEQDFNSTSWAIQRKSRETDQQFEIDRRIWSNRGVNILDVSLDDYVAEIQKRIANLKPVSVPKPPPVSIPA